MTDTETENPEPVGPLEEPDEGDGQDAGLDIDGPADDDVNDGDDGEQAADGGEPQARSLTPEEHNERASKTERSFRTYAGNVRRNYADDAEYLTECPLCPDQHKGFVDVRQAGFVPQEVQDACRFYFGLARAKDYPQSRSHHTCANCEGEGKVATGSNVPEWVSIKCTTCDGKGFTGETPTAPLVAVQGVTGPTVYPDTPATQAFEDRDEWDEPRILPDGRENPNFGRMPNRKVPVEPWGQTAGLTALDTVAS